MSKRKYNQEFKEEALSLAESIGNYSEAARQLGISDSLIHAWKQRKSKKDSSDPEKQELSPEEEIKQLRAENLKLKKVNHILKTAAAFFSQDHLK